MRPFASAQRGKIKRQPGVYNGAQCGKTHPAPSHTGLHRLGVQVGIRGNPKPEKPLKQRGNPDQMAEMSEM